MQVQTAIVILNWNGRFFLEKFLPFLIKSISHENASIWVIDNDSKDDSLLFLKNNYSKVNIIELDKNYGFTGGYNKGLKQIEAKYYLLLNSDIEVPEHWLNPLINLMETNQDIAICGPKLLDYNNRNTFEYAGGAGGFLDKFAYPFCKGRIFETCEKDFGQYDKESDCFWISGAALMIRSKIFYQINGFDNDFFAHQEEIDLCWRVQNLGYRIVCEPKSFVYHVGGGTLPKSNPFKTYLNFRNNLYLIKKNLPKYSRQKVLIVRFLLDHIAAYRMLFQGSFKDYFAVFKAWTHFLFKSKIMKSKRNALKPKSPKYLNSFYKKSIVYNYYLRKKTTFKSLGEVK